MDHILGEHTKMKLNTNLGEVPEKTLVLLFFPDLEFGRRVMVGYWTWNYSRDKKNMGSRRQT